MAPALLQYRTASLKTLKRSNKKSLTTGHWQRMPPVAAEKVSPMLKKFKLNEEFLLCMRPMVAFKWVAVAEAANDDGSRHAVILKRSLTFIEEQSIDFNHSNPGALKAKTQDSFMFST